MGIPTSPRDVPYVGVDLVTLAGSVQRHAWIVHEHAHGVGEPLDGETVALHCLAGLAFSHCLAERAVSTRWVLAVEALGAGASVEHTAAAMGRTPAELCAGLRAWAAEQLRFGLISADKHAQVLALIAGGVSGDE